MAQLDLNDQFPRQQRVPSTVDQMSLLHMQSQQWMGMPFRLGVPGVQRPDNAAGYSRDVGSGQGQRVPVEYGHVNPPRSVAIPNMQYGPSGPAGGSNMGGVQAHHPQPTSGRPHVPGPPYLHGPHSNAAGPPPGQFGGAIASMGAPYLAESYLPPPPPTVYDTICPKVSICWGNCLGDLAGLASPLGAAC